ILSAMYREIIYEKMLTAAGGNKKGFITTETKLSAEAMEQLHKNWRDMYATTDNTMMILNKGLQFHESSNTSVEMQLNENKVRNNELVCQIFGMSSEAVSGKLGDDAAIAVIKNAVIPVVTAFENALDRGLLLPSERDRTYYAFDTSELLKGDILKRYQAYKTGLECNVLQIDEARYKEDLPPLGLTWIKLGLQDVLYDPKTKVIYTPNMNQSMTMSENKVSFGNKPVDKAADGGIMEERADSGTKIVCVWGSPLSGKTTFVRNHAGKTDVVWDWDMIQQAVSLSDSHQESPPQVLRMLLKLRKAFVRAAADCGAKTAWFICTRPNKYVRDMLGDTAEYIKMDVSKDECYRRLAADENRPDKQKMAVLIEDFFSKEPLEKRDWVTINGKHVFIGDDGGEGAGSGSMGGFLKQPDGTVQPRLYSNGGSKHIEQDFQKNQESFENAVASGAISTKLDKKAQSAHKQGSPAFKERVSKGETPSYTTLDNMEVQSLINKHNSDGTLYLVNGQYRRVITEAENFGMFGDRKTKTYLPTNRATIHYSKHGAHLVPAPPKED
ncbi:MAG: phage portal protein, partial [Acutalibacteraceae bacterium]|nr:phage portal protein [Acutalibacteraceae bacterium]